MEKENLLKALVEHHKETGHVGSFGDKGCPLCNDVNKAS